MKRWAALLKGVNVGGNRKLPMADLRGFVAALGYGEVRTLLASGNVVFDTPETDGAALEARLEREAAKRLGLTTDFLVRSADDLRAVIAANPFAEQARVRPSHLLVHFHRDPVPQDLVAAMTAAHDGPETLFAHGRELYVDYAEGIGTSTLPQAMARAKFPKLNTARNWNTVGKLLAIVKG
ncbi:DUF1697 domain-containing protein [Sphingomonas donggukensis]|uniref:DUF1697 domain-containing protein n=1 Tax=Sphingomonas donggukensis TaxID=2949093 RepID=A0ABY4TTR5_9SPHN|nr:DUF1697 domain-containing protein [Sphingomonas donggukensis]URW75723.1 DUF1697 domain-containing protein [Sphingomonas donggukensis]